MASYHYYTSTIAEPVLADQIMALVLLTFSSCTNVREIYPSETDPEDGDLFVDFSVELSPSEKLILDSIISSYQPEPERYIVEADQFRLIDGLSTNVYTDNANITVQPNTNTLILWDSIGSLFTSDDTAIYLYRVSNNALISDQYKLTVSCNSHLNIRLALGNSSPVLIQKNHAIKFFIHSTEQIMVELKLTIYKIMLVG